MEPPRRRRRPVAAVLTSDPTSWRPVPDLPEASARTGGTGFPDNPMSRAGGFSGGMPWPANPGRAGVRGSRDRPSTTAHGPECGRGGESSVASAVRCGERGPTFVAASRRCPRLTAPFIQPVADAAQRGAMAAPGALGDLQARLGRVRGARAGDVRESDDMRPRWSFRGPAARVPRAAPDHVGSGRIPRRSSRIADPGRPSRVLCRIVFFRKPEATSWDDALCLRFDALSFGAPAFTSPECARGS